MMPRTGPKNKSFSLHEKSSNFFFWFVSLFEMNTDIYNILIRSQSKYGKISTRRIQILVRYLR